MEMVSVADCVSPTPHILSIHLGDHGAVHRCACGLQWQQAVAHLPEGFV